MSSAQTTTLDAYHAALVGAVRATFGARFATVGPFDPAELLDLERPLNTPALYLQIEASDLEDPETRQPLRGRVAHTLAVALHVMLSTRTAGDLQVALDVLASAVANLVRASDPDSRLAGRPGNRWGLGTAAGAPTRIGIMPADWQSGLNGYDSRIVRFEQVCYLPEDPLACLAEPAPDPIPPGDE
jgi:hypothetical protein